MRRGRGIGISVGVLGFTFDDEETAGAAFPGTGSGFVKADPSSNGNSVLGNVWHLFNLILSLKALALGVHSCDGGFSTS